MTVAPIINKFLTLAATVYIIRTLPVAEYGIYITVCTYIGLFFVIIDAGLNTLVTREIARDHDSANRYFVNVIVLRTLIAFFAFILANGIAYFLNYPAQTTAYIFIFSLFLFSHGIFENYLFIFNGLERMEYAAAESVDCSFSTNALYILVIYLGYGIKPLFIIPTVISMIAGLAMYLIIIRKFIHFRPQVDLSFGLRLLKEAWPFAVLAIFGMIYNKIDIIMLSKMKTVSDVGYYGSAYKLINALFIFSSAYTVAIFPLFSQLSTGAEDKLFFSYKLSFKIMAAVAFPLVAGVSFLGQEIVTLFFTARYLAAVAPLKILIWSVLLIYFGTIFQCLMYTFNWQRTVAGVFFGMTFLNVGLNFILIPHYSYIGASVATVICETINLVIFYYLISAHIGHLPWGRVFLKPLMATAVMSVFLYFLQPLAAKNVHLYLLPIIVVVVVIYWFVFKLSNPFNESEIEQLVKIPLLKHLL